MYASTGDERFKQRVDYIVGRAGAVPEQFPGGGLYEGYLSAFPESFIDRVENQKAGLGALVHAAQNHGRACSMPTSIVATRRRWKC